MPVDRELADKMWARFQQARDSGHDDFVKKSDVCEAFFRGDQWNPADRAALAAARRPAMTVNKILPTLLNVFGEQIFNRAEISFRPRGQPNEPVAQALTKVFKQISDNNQLDWRRSEMFADGVITSRGFLDARMDYSDSVTGDVRITNLNPKNVVVDPDAEDYDPDTWSDVSVTKWYTADDISVMHNPEDAELLRTRAGSMMDYDYDLIDVNRDRFGRSNMPLFADNIDLTGVVRNIRVLDRQYRKLDKQKHFVERETGETRPIPADFDRDRIAWFVDTFGFGVMTKLVRRIRWTVVADDIILHDEWSPYDHFTVVPYFPVFRHGRTIGFVENLTGPQEILNKSLSQELHVVNTTANSGYKVKQGALANMTVEELEQKGAQTGIVIEVNGEVSDIEKITPNSVPQGLDRISFKAEESIKTISGVNDSMLGMDREDVAGRAIEKKKQSGATGLAKSFDNLTRTDFILARHILCMVQKFYTDERIVTITKDQATGALDTTVVNQEDPVTGQIKNDLTLGEYDVVVTSVPHRETLEDSEFEQLVALREMGVKIPDTALVNASRARNKIELIKQMTGDQDSPEGQAAAALQQRAQEAEVSKVEGEAAQKHADAQLKQAKAVKEGVAAEKEAATPIEGPEQASQAEEVATVAEIDREERRFEHEVQMDHLELQRQREKDRNDAQLKAQDMAQRRVEEQARQAQQAAAAAMKPQPKAS